ncbi:MAG: AAA family ATPase, partial [Candidatus Saccharimonadales bacterium]
MQPAPTVIALEGGPCSGKSTLMGELAIRASELDRPLELIPEVATEFINSYRERGLEVSEMALNNRPAFLEFQTDILRAIISNIERAKLTHSGTDAIIVADRAEIASYVTADEYKQILIGLKQDKSPIHSIVDRVIFLPSVACEEPELYSRLVGSNAARYETSAEQAAAVSKANLLAVSTHPELEVAWGGDFKSKIGHLVNSIFNNELEGEVKQAVPGHAAEALVSEAERAGNLLNVMNIIQSYHQLGDRTFRLRQTTTSGSVHYHLTIKTGSGAVRHELQRSLTPATFTLLKSAEQLGKTLAKRRHLVLDEPDDEDRRRLWFADYYTSPRLPDWHFETEVENEAEAAALMDRYATSRRRIVESAQSLIFS